MSLAGIWRLVARPPAGRARARGQTLVLFALLLVVLLGAAALVVDVARVYALQRMERSVADAAALAGAQDLQTAGSHAAVTPAQQKQARTDALANASAALGGTSDPKCNPNADIVNCDITVQGSTLYQVTVKTPSPSVVNVDADRAVQVTIREPSVSLTLARLFGQNSWNVSITSVAGLGFGAEYAIITLRPPEPLKSGSDQNEKDINIDGGTVVTVTGDVGTNTNVVISGTGSALNLTAGFDYRVGHYDTYQAWTSPPPGKILTSLIPDPDYVVPSRTNAPAGVQDTNPATCGAAITAAVDAGYKGHGSSTDPTNTYTLTASNTTCWKPGIYSTNIGQNSTNAKAYLLEPGVYFFDKGLSMNGTLIGGYQAGTFDSTTGAPVDHTGVALVFPEANSVNKGAFAGNSATLVALNAGTCIASSDPSSCTTSASPAQDASGTVIEVVFKSSAGDVYAPESLIVAPKDANCQVVQPYNTACNDNGNNTIGLPGGGNLFVAGVQYAPSDNVTIAGGASGTGYLGQIIAWTVHYTGGSRIGEVFPGHTGNGVLRLDAACSGPGMACVP